VIDIRWRIYEMARREDVPFSGSLLCDVMQSLSVAVDIEGVGDGRHITPRQMSKAFVDFVIWKYGQFYDHVLFMGGVKSGRNLGRAVMLLDANEMLITRKGDEQGFADYPLMLNLEIASEEALRRAADTAVGIHHVGT